MTQDEETIRKTQVTKSGKQWCWYWFETLADGTKERRREYGGTFNKLSEERKQKYYVNRQRYWQRKARIAYRRERAEIPD